jgi:hypothetical protein
MDVAKQKSGESGHGGNQTRGLQQLSSDHESDKHSLLEYIGKQP